jgi:hypothetical protein
VFVTEVHLLHLSVTVETSLIFRVRFGSSIREEICAAVSPKMYFEFGHLFECSVGDGLMHGYGHRDAAGTALASYSPNMHVRRIGILCVYWSPNKLHSFHSSHTDHGWASSSAHHLLQRLLATRYKSLKNIGLHELKKKNQRRTYWKFGEEQRSMEEEGIQW